MAEPQPSNVQEGADPPDVLPASKEDRKAAAALSSLDAKEDQDATPNKKEVDLKALGEAMKNLELSQGTGKKTPSNDPGKKEEAPKKLVKVDAADVSLLGMCTEFERDIDKGKTLTRLHYSRPIGHAQGESYGPSACT